MEKAAVAASTGEHQEYIQQKVNPILENLVTQLLLERPEPMAPFMIKWLAENSKTPTAGLLEGVNELSAMKAELEQLKQEVKKLEEEVGAEQKDDDEEEEESDDDAPDELPPPPASYGQKQRASVSAEAYGAWNQKKEFVPPVHAKSEEQKGKIKEILTKSFMFSALQDNDFEVVINAMQERTVEANERLIEQGDDGNNMFVIESGQMDCYKKIDGTDKLVKECKAGDYFGELALLYNCPRAASVVAHEKSVMWELDRETFNYIVRDAATLRREKYEAFLRSVPILETMEAYERNSMGDALQTQSAKEGEVIVQQGEAGDRFYILEKGECKVLKRYVEGSEPQEVMQYKPGDYFGELALLKNEPRAATVIAKTDVKLLYLERRVFQQLLGPIEEILRRDASKYT
jgi:cAMP-dependent protein kinase regulator